MVMRGRTPKNFVDCCVIAASSQPPEDQQYSRGVIADRPHGESKNASANARFSAIRAYTGIDNHEAHSGDATSTGGAYAPATRIVADCLARGSGFRLEERHSQELDGSGGLGHERSDQHGARVYSTSSG